MKDMDFKIKKIIREQLEEFLNFLEEQEIQQNVNLHVQNPKDELIYDFSDGRIFGESSLKADIIGLAQYYLYDYFPINEQLESWKFEFDTVKDMLLSVEIEHSIQNNKSFWSLKFGVLKRTPLNQDDRLPKVLSILHEIKNIEGYDNFVGLVNQKLTDKIEPSEF